MAEKDISEKLLSVLTGDHRFEESADEFPEKGVEMCEVLDVIENRGIEKGRLQGLEEGRIEGKIEILYDTLHYSPQMIADQLHIPIGTVQDIIANLPPSDKYSE